MLLLGKVTQASPNLRVRLDGNTNDASAGLLNRGDAYSPAVNARVVLLRRGTRLVILGEVA